MEKIKETEIEIDGGGLAIILCCIFLILGIFIGIGIADHGRRRIEKTQAEIRLDIKEIRKRDKLAKIIDSLFQERNKIINWNKEHIVLTVEPKPKAEGN